MKVLIVGAGGYIGSAAGRAMLAAGHQVSGLARSEESARALAKIGVGAVAGDARDAPGLGEVAKGFDGVVFTPRVSFDEEDRALKALIAAFKGSDRPLVYTSGTAVFAQPTPAGDRPGDSFAEDDPYTPPPWPMMAPRHETEAMVRAAGPEVRTTMIRPPMVWGHGGSLLIDSIFESIRKTSSACYVGEGLHRLSNVHVDDLGELHRLALEKGRAGAVYHAASGETDFRTLAEWCAQEAGCETRSVSFEEGCAIWPLLGPVFGASNRSLAVRSRAELGWSPLLADVPGDIRCGAYKARSKPLIS